MKKGWKIFWIACAIAGGLGIFCLAIAIGMGVTLETIENRFPNGITIGKFESTETEIDTDTPVSYEGISKLDIDLSAGEVEILVAEGTSIEIETEGISKKLNLRCYQEEDRLVIDSEKDVAGIVNQSLGTVYVYLPKDFALNEAKINVHAGTLFIEEIYANELSIDVGAGEADIQYFCADEADFDCGAGEITVWGDAKKAIDIDCGMGSVYLYALDNEENYNYDLACGIGEIVCGSHTCSGIGSDQKVSNNASKDMNIDCGVGEVIVEFEGHHEETHEENHEENHF